MYLIATVPGLSEHFRIARHSVNDVQFNRVSKDGSSVSLFVHNQDSKGNIFQNQYTRYHIVIANGKDAKEEVTQPASRKLLLDHLNTFPSREIKHSPNEFIEIGHTFNGIDGRSELCVLGRLTFNKVKIRPKELEYHGFPIYPSTTISTQARIRVFEQKREGFNGPSDLTPSYYVWSQILLDSEDETRARRVDFPIILTDIERSSRLRPNKKHQQQLQEAFIAKNSMALVTSHATKEIFVCHVIQFSSSPTVLCGKRKMETNDFPDEEKSQTETPKQKRVKPNC